MNREELRSPDSINSYTVGWICALEEEYVCACRMLDEEFPDPEMVEDNDDNTYVYGRIAKHHVVIGCLPAGRYGNSSAARVARDMVRTFPKLRFALMVGIGGGAPTTKYDIRLGDVVVSQPRDGFGGVIQYDLGKKLQDGRFQKTGQLNAPPEKLLGVIPEMRRLYNEKWKPDRIAHHLQRMSDMEDYQQPLVDRLYKADYQHVDGTNCEQCDQSLVIERPERQNQRIVRVHYGTIASGNSVLKDAIMRDVYAKDPEMNILCFEMEAAGLMNNLPCLVIRGICDYCDSHKNDDWHKYAALTAAAYARELLLVLRPQRVDAMPSWAGQVAHELRQVRQNITMMVDNQSLEKLSVAKGATFDSYENQHDECLLGTRIELLRKIEEWTKSSRGKCIFWLNGMAGTGKSTISRTVASHLKEEGSLGASFFFKRGEGDRGNAKRLFPTLIQQLVTRIPQLQPEILKAIEHDSDISEKALGEQFEKLFLQPLQIVGLKEIMTVVIVIDALDECESKESQDDIRTILKLLPRVHMSTCVRVRFFLTSRPELPIRLGFKDIKKDHQNLDLHEIPRPEIEHDIAMFLEHKLSNIQTTRSLPINWPGKPHIKTLTTMSVPLFIFAATICRILEDDQYSPEESLLEILAHQTDHSKLNGTYLPVLDRILMQQQGKRKTQLAEEYRRVLGTIIILETPLSVTSLSILTGMPQDLINRRLKFLHSVLRISTDQNEPVRLFHLSFRDFLLDPDTRDMTPLWINEKEMHNFLTRQCLEIMDRSLTRNICRLSGDCVLRNEIDTSSIDHHLPLELQYACRYWAHHLLQCLDPVTELIKAFSFLKIHLLHWMEAMGVLGIISEVVGVIKRLQSLIQSNEHPKISDFLHDAMRFTLKNRQLADMAPLQVYSSGLMFTPRNSIIKGLHNNELSSWSQLPKVEDSWNANIQTLEGHTDTVSSVAFSPDGRLLASGSWDNTVQLWDLSTGELLQTLEDYSGRVYSVAFSPDSQLLASGSGVGDNTVKLWDPNTGELYQILKDHSSVVSSVTFSPDGWLLASGSHDHTVKLWDLSTYELRRTLKGHSGRISSVAFSADGRLLASGFDDFDTVKLWDPSTGELRQTLKGHSGRISSVAFSGNGRLLASGSKDNAIKLWDPSTGELRQPLKGHSGTVSSVAFSPDGRLLASSDWDGSVKLWDLITGKLRQTLKGHSGAVYSVAFSPDSRLLASGSDKDNTVKLWDPSMGELHRTLDGHSGAVYSMAFSGNGRLLASASQYNDIKLWDPSTGELRQTLKGDRGWVSSVVFSSDSQLLASGSLDHTVKLWDPSTGELLQILNGCSNLAVFSPNSQLLASSSNDYIVKLWDPSTGKLLQTLIGHSDEVLSVAFSPDSQVLASGSRDHTLKLWDPSTGKLCQTLKGHSGWVYSVAFSPDSQLLVSSSRDNTVKLWDPSTGELLQTLIGHSGEVLSVAFSHDGQLLASYSHDETVKLWDPSTGELCETLEGHSMWRWQENGLGISILEGKWLCLHSKKLLWLAQEYRPNCLAVNGGIIALGHVSGRVSFLSPYVP